MLLTLSGCIDEYTADIPSDDSELLVVEGTICSSRLNKFILSRTQAVNSSTQPRMVSGAKVSVHGSVITREVDVLETAADGLEISSEFLDLRGFAGAVKSFQYNKHRQRVYRYKDIQKNPYFCIR